MKKCPYCAEEIQEEAVFCKHCKNSLAKGISDVKIQTVELTSKKYKVRYLYASVVLLLGFILLFYGGAKSNMALLIIGCFLLTGSIIALVITKIQIWWHHR